MAGTLLLDVDGVLIRNKELLNHVKDNCVRYVQAKMPECKNPEELNRVLYLAHGHTARGLTYTFGVPAYDFNEKVYDKKLIEHLYEVIYGNEFQSDAKEIFQLTREGWNVSLFTNAPHEWARPVAEAIGEPIGVVCPGRDLSKTWMKPEASAYADFPKYQKYVYIDDSLKNLGTTRWLSNWTPVHFTEDKKDPKLWCPQVQSVWEIALFSRSTVV